jgi:hypothetical protein
MSKRIDPKDKFTIDNFTNQILGKGISASNLYSFDIEPTPQFSSFVMANMGTRYGQNVSAAADPVNAGNYKLNMLCSEIQIPGVDMTASDIKSPHKGLTQKMVSGKVYNELDVQFYCDLNSTPLSFFRAWQDMIMGNWHLGFRDAAAAQEQDTLYSVNSNYHKNKHKAYAQQYYDDYTCGITINKLEKFGVPKESVWDAKAAKNVDKRPKKYDVSFKARLENAYPYSMSSVPYNSGQSELVRVSVGFYYEYQTFQFQWPSGA